MSRRGDRLPARPSRLAAVHADCNLIQLRQRNGNSVVTIAETRDTNYTNCHEALDRSNPCKFVSGADGIGDTEGKAATGSGERAGRQASFKFVSRFRKEFSKEACHSFTHPINPWGNYTQSVDALVAVTL